MDHNSIELKKCILCNSAFFGGPDDMECPNCTERYRKIKDQIREYLWSMPSQSASLEQIAEDLGIPRRIMRAIARDPHFNVVIPDEKESTR